MKVSVACIPCFIKQLSEVAEITLKDKNRQLQLIKDSLKKLSEIPLNKLKPPQVAKIMHDFVKEKTAVFDPYINIKNKSNKLARSIIKEISRLVEKSPDPFEIGLRLSIAGNIIDYGQANDVNDTIVKKSIEESLKARLDIEIIKELYSDIEKANNILYLADNAGEIYFDKLFIQHLSKKDIIFAVRGKPIINDATIKDAIEAGINKICKVIDTGDGTPGIILKDCSKDFIDAFHEADIIISKGQGNYETLSDIKDKKIYFLFKIKCVPVAENTGFKIGETAILCNIR